MAELVLGIDLGTSYFKLGLFDRSGNLRGLGRVSVQPDLDGDRCELPVDRFWATLKDGLRRALEEAGAAAADIQAVSYSSQANSFLLLDDQHRPLTPLILWPDQRASPVHDNVTKIWNQETFLETTGLGIEV